jgi:hypothetical protein
MDNKRTNPRRRVHDFGKIIFRGGRDIVACVIVDASDGGARLVVDIGALKNGMQVPDSFVLHNKKARLFHEAKVVRRSGRTVAVRLVSALDSSDIGADSLVAVVR